MYLPTLSPVLANPVFVTRNSDAIKAMAEQLSTEDFSLMETHGDIFPEKDDDDLIQFLCVSVALDFCFTNPFTQKGFRATINGKDYEGSDAMNACLVKAIYQEWPLLEMDYLKKISLRELRAVFSGITTEIPLIEWRLDILHEIGNGLTKYGGLFANLFRENDFQVFGNSQHAGIVPTIAKEFPMAFEDLYCWKYGSLETNQAKIHFRKKAQLLCCLYNSRSITSNGKLPLLKDVPKIGPMADYQIPRILVDKGVLKYSPLLMKMIVDGTTLKSDGREVIEIRAQTVMALEILLGQINIQLLRMRKPVIHHGHLDAKLWPMGRKAKTPQHLAFTTTH